MQEKIREIEADCGVAGVSHEVMATLAVAYEMNSVRNQLHIANLQRERDYAIAQQEYDLALSLTTATREQLAT